MNVLPAIAITELVVLPIKSVFETNEYANSPSFNVSGIVPLLI
jgi:hypothetical protein